MIKMMTMRCIYNFKASKQVYFTGFDIVDKF